MTSWMVSSVMRRLSGMMMWFFRRRRTSRKLIRSSVGSIDEIVNGDRNDSASDSQLADRIEEIFARKGSTIQGREKCYKTYVHLLTIRCSAESLNGKEDELIAAFLKSVREESSEKESVLALKGNYDTQPQSFCSNRPSRSNRYHISHISVRDGL